MSIDGWFYILKEDLSMIKFFSNPYRVESLSLNKLPRNYTYDQSSNIFLYTRANLSYVYMLMNNKIWIFEPNTQSYASTKSLTYVGQIEWLNEQIDSFYVKTDGNILVASKKGIYKLGFQVNDDKLVLQ
jgi:hypothetical protein